MDRFETLNATIKKLKLTPKDILRNWIFTHEVDTDTLEEVFCRLELDATLEPQIGGYAFINDIFAPYPTAYSGLLGIVSWLNPDANAKPGERGLILIPKKFTDKWANSYGRTGINHVYDGAANTDKLMVWSNLKKYVFYAAQMCNKYSSKGIEKGQAFLPAVEQLSAIVKNIKPIRAAMKELGLDFGGKLLTSTEYTEHYAYTVDVETGEVSGISKIQNCDYYPVIAF